MIQTPVRTVQPSPVTDGEALREGLDATRAAFHDLLISIPADRWHEKSPATEWTVAEVFVHLTWALEYLPKEVSCARRGKGMFNFPKWLADPLSYWYIRLIARKATPQSIRRRYDAAMDAAIEALATVPDSDWSCGAEFYGEGFHTVADLFRVPAHHLSEHTIGL